MRLPAYLLGLLTMGAALTGCGSDPDQDPPPQTVSDETALQNANTHVAAPPVTAPPAEPAPQVIVVQAPDAEAAQASPQSQDAGAAPDGGPVLPTPLLDPCPACGLG